MLDMELDFSLLLADVKNNSDITWEDKDTDKKLTGIIKRGISYLNNKAGAELDYFIEGQPRSLLFDYTRYARANALDEFAINYQHELLSLHLEYRVKEAVQNAKAEAAG